MTKNTMLHTGLRHFTRLYFVQVFKVLRSLKPLNVFLDLSWMGELPQRIFICLAGDTPLIQQFVTLCLGHTGLTYCNTNLLSVESNDYRKIVWGGDITSQKAAAKQTLPPIKETLCGKKVDISTGMVVAKTELSDVAKRTWFGIVMGCSNLYRSYNQQLHKLGTLDVGGLSVMERAVGNTSIASVKVVNCGVVY